MARSGNGIKQYALEQLCRTGARSVPHSKTTQPRRVVSINEQHNLFVASHLQHLNESAKHRVDLVRARYATRNALDVAHLISR